MTGKQTAARTLSANRCENCGLIHAYPVGGCSACGGMSFTTVPLPEYGCINSYTVIHRAPVPAFADKVPYTLAFIGLDGGGRILAPLVGDVTAVGIGARVRLLPSGEDGAAAPLHAELLGEPT